MSEEEQIDNKSIMYRSVKDAASRIAKSAQNKITKIKSTPPSDNNIVTS